MPKNEPQLPRDALKHVDIGHSFAEYDQLLTDKSIFVKTPAIAAATSDTGSKCLFVGRRGTGKTAITRYIELNKRDAVLITPQSLTYSSLPFDHKDLTDPHQKPFRSLSFCYALSLLYETIHTCIQTHLINENELCGELLRDKQLILEDDFDYRFLNLMEMLEKAVRKEKTWLRFIKKPKSVIKDIVQNELVPTTFCCYLLIDRLDEDWDGSDTAVVMLMALAHACVELSVQTRFMRPLLFVRENIFERVRKVDNEYGRLETWVTSLEWTEPLLLEVVERRLARPFPTKVGLKGKTWAQLFEEIDGEPSFKYILANCQLKPRDVLTYCSFAVETAKNNLHDKVTSHDIVNAKARFSDSRLKELGDEYAENYPQISVILQLFYGLGQRMTYHALGDFIKALLAHDLVKASCGAWIYGYTPPERFAELLFSIGFFGVGNGNAVRYRSQGVKITTIPEIKDTTVFEIHPTYREALQLRDSLVTTLDGTTLRSEGVAQEIPGELSFEQYLLDLDTLADDLKSLPLGHEGQTRYEELVGEVIKMCFFTKLNNVEAQARDVNGRIRRDWVASICATTGFWQRISQLYSASQIIWECKNFEELDPDAFRQISDYLRRPIGRFGIISFRGEIKKHYYEHIRRLSTKDNGEAIVILLTDKDILTFIRQAKTGKLLKDTHINDIFDRTVRLIS